MARLRYPQNNTAWLYTGAGQAIRQPSNTEVYTLYMDQACTTLADIQTPAGASIAGSVIYLMTNGLIPEFMGPDDDTTVLWMKPASGDPFPVTAMLTDYVAQQFAILTGQIQSLQISRPMTLSQSGTLATGNSKAWIYNDSDVAWSIDSLRATVGTAPTGSGVTVTLRNMSAVALGTVTIPAGQTTALASLTSVIVAPSTGVTFSIDAVGSTIPGSDLTFQINVEQQAGS
jgi:hypothetical protein